MTDDAVEGVYAVESDYLGCVIQVGVAGGKVLRVAFPDAADEGAARDHPLLDRIEAYLEGVEDDFEDVDVALTLPTDQRAVLEALRGVPYGEEVSVERLTRMTAGLDPDDGDVETTRLALAANPTPLVIPDHRVRDGPSGAPPAVEQRLREIERL
jgi:methylated-DNA-[protein]-cysteine S-methyltransferase